MTNKTTAQDMEAESVDKNDATLIKSSDHNEGITTEAPGNDDTQHIAGEVNEALENPHTDLDIPEEAAKAIEEVAPEEPELIEEEPDYSIIEPGSLARSLKKCREEADISIEDAAQEMRLPLSVVKALEAENFADLPDPPYVRGYLRSYARLNESDPTNLINHYETLRGADPKDIASFTPVTPRYQANSKKPVSPTTIKLAGFSMIVMLLVVLSMIPAVSQWASDTWQSFSEPQHQKLAASRQAAAAQSTDNTEQDASAQEAEGTGNTDNVASNSDTATPDESEQLAPDQDAGDTTTQDQKTDTATADTDNTETAQQDETPEQAADATASDTPAEDTDTTDTVAEKTDTTESGSESDATDKTQNRAANPNAEQSDSTAGDTADTPATDTTDANTDT
ncbi:MAG: Unknown protein, partial [uncultured Thiotrichaceae bacterium]